MVGNQVDTIFDGLQVNHQQSKTIYTMTLYVLL